MSLLEHLAGKWVMQGPIGGKQVTHDVEAHWLLNGEYLQLHEVSREKAAGGGTAYEAIVLLGWDTEELRYACLWLDTTSGNGLRGGPLGHGTRTGDSILYIFQLSPTESIHTTFRYSRNSDTWQLVIDDVKDDKADRFADVKLVRARESAVK